MQASFYAPLKVLLCVTCLFHVCLTQEATKPADRVCVDNGAEPDDELSDFDSVFYSFAQKLELYTGLSGTEKFSVTLDRCEGKVCEVNPNGAAIWEARMDFYESYMIDDSPDETQILTLDGCLCYSQNVSDYQDCMVRVRHTMINQLDTVLVAKFKSIVESDCGSVTQNCINAI